MEVSDVLVPSLPPGSAYYGHCWRQDIGLDEVFIWTTTAVMLLCKSGNIHKSLLWQSRCEEMFKKTEELRSNSASNVLAAVLASIVSLLPDLTHLFPPLPSLCLYSCFCSHIVNQATKRIWMGHLSSFLFSPLSLGYFSARSVSRFSCCTAEQIVCQDNTRNSTNQEHVSGARRCLCSA